MSASSNMDAITCSSLMVMIGEVAAPIVSLELREGFNQHGQLSVTIMAEEQVKEYILYEGGSNLSLLYLQNEAACAMFQGMILNMQVSAVAQTYYINILAKTSSYQMDLSKLNLSFQDTAMTAHQLIDNVVSLFPEAKTLLAFPDRAIGHIVVQYQETTWEFLKRFASEFGAYLYVDSSSLGIQIKFGLSDAEETVDWEQHPYTIRRNTFPQQNGITREALLVYEVHAYEILPLGSRINFKNQDLYIGEIYRYLEDGLLVNQYKLYLEAGLQAVHYYNSLLGGISINGVVTNISRNQVQVSMETDGLSSYASQYYFPYSTVAASPDGGGWYCMPQAGDQVRIFFPVSDEKEGYAITNIKGESSPAADSPMGNPDIKDITAPDGKTVTFVDNGIMLAVGGGKGSITLTNDGKAEIKTEEDIEIGAAQEVYVSTDGNLKLSADIEIELISDAGGSIRITEESVDLSASKIMNN